MPFRVSVYIMFLGAMDFMYIQHNFVVSLLVWYSLKSPLLIKFQLVFLCWSAKTNAGNWNIRNTYRVDLELNFLAGSTIVSTS